MNQIIKNTSRKHAERWIGGGVSREGLNFRHKQSLLGPTGTHTGRPPHRGLNTHAHRHSTQNNQSSEAPGSGGSTPGLSAAGDGNHVSKRTSLCIRKDGAETTAQPTKQKMHCGNDLNILHTWSGKALQVVVFFFCFVFVF